MKKFLLFSFLVVMAVTGLCYEVIETEHVKVFYNSEYESIATYVAQIAENYWTYVTDLIGYEPKRKAKILLVDSGVIANGAYTGLGNVIIYLTPPRTPFLNNRSWYELVVVHELTHFVHSEYETGFPAILDAILTGTLVFSSQFRSPFVESTTLFAESHISPYQGRLNNPITSMGLYAAAIKGGWFPDLVSASAAPGDNFLGSAIYYFIPSGFYNYLSQRFGHDKVKEFLRKFSGCFMGLGINSVSNEVFGNRLETLYGGWIEELEKKAEEYDNQGVEVFTADKLYIKDFQITGGKIYALCLKFTDMRTTFGFPEGYIHIVDLYNGKGEIIQAPFAGAPMMVENGKIYFSVLQPESPGSKKILRIIRKFDTFSHTERELLRGVISTFDVYNGTIFYAIYDPAKMVSQIYGPGEKIAELEGFVREMDVSGEGMVLLVSREGNGNEVVLLKNGKQIPLLTDPFLKSSINWYGRKIIFCSTYETGYMNVYSLDPATGEIRKLTDKSVFWVVRPQGEYIYALGYSQRRPATAIYRVRPLDMPFEIPEYEPPVLDLKTVEMERKDGNIEYIKDLMTPAMRVPIVDVVSAGASPSVGVGYGTLHISLDSRNAFLIAPILYTTSTADFTLGGMISMYTQLSDNLQIVSTLKTTHIFDPSDYSLDLNMNVLLAEEKLSKDQWLYFTTFLNWHLPSGDPIPGFTFGYRDEIDGISSDVKLSVWMLNPLDSPDYFARISLKYSFLFRDSKLLTLSINQDSLISLTEELIFPLKSLKFGILDPYFYVNNTYLALSAGMDETQTFWLGGWLGVQVESFVFPRFPLMCKLKVKWIPKKGKVVLDFGI